MKTHWEVCQKKEQFKKLNNNSDNASTSTDSTWLGLDLYASTVYQYYYCQEHPV